MADLIDRQTAIDTAIEAADRWDGGYSPEREGIIRKFFDKVPVVQSDHNADIGKKVSIPCGQENDLISRRSAIDAIMGQPPEPHYPSWYAAQIEKLPAAQPDLSEYSDKLWRSAYERGEAEAEKPQWIPCSERLPECNEPVLTWDGYVFCIEKRIPYIRDDDGEPIEGDWWVGDEYDEYESECYPNLRDGAAIAWMPLPEPYRGGDSR